VASALDACVMLAKAVPHMQPSVAGGVLQLLFVHEARTKLGLGLHLVLILLEVCNRLASCSACSMCEH
jgi:hypothetical protein